MTTAPDTIGTTAGSSFYRYRSIKSLLGEHKELEAQTIYFAGPDELNDPMEGFQDVFWEGDYVLWKNLIRHYVLCLLMSFEVATIMSPEFKRDSVIPLLSLTASTLPTPALKEHHDHICSKFFGEKGLLDFIRLLPTVRTKVYREELSCYLTSLHGLALHHVMNRLREVGLLKQALGPPFPQDMAETTTRNLRNMLAAIERSKSSETDVTAALFSSGSRALQQMALLSLISQDNQDQVDRGWRFIAFEFPDFYCQHIATTLYPGWYAACFVGNPTHAAMWAHYGDRHEGVCLKFRTEKSADGIPHLTLNGVTGRSHSSSGGTSEIRGERKFSLQKLTYAKGFPKIDFFRSLGRLPTSVLNKDWYSESGEASEAMHSVFANEEVWRQGYWDNLRLVSTTKFDDWKHEDEYRAVIHTLQDRTIEKPLRVYTYNFADLEGIIFGLNTSIDDKLAIMRIIERKCVESGRKEFEFLQASYSSGTSRFDVFPLPHIKLA